MHARTNPRPSLYEQLEALPAGLTGEILDGQLYAQPRPSLPHGFTASSLGYDLIGPFQRGRGGPGGWWFIDEPELHFIRDAEVDVPDLHLARDRPLRRRRAGLNRTLRRGHDQPGRPVGTTAKAFTRSRRLTFPLVVTLLLRKGVKSLQNMVNEAMGWLGEPPVTGSAFSQARYKLRHTAFIELTDKAVVGTVSAGADYRTFWGFRVLAVDGAKILLPDTADVRAAVGTIAYSNGTPETTGERPYALASVLYDVLNRVGVEAVLGQAKAYEVDLAVAHLACTHPGDLLVMDRNYPSYRMLAELIQSGRNFVVRCSAASFAPRAGCSKGRVRTA